MKYSLLISSLLINNISVDAFVTTIPMAPIYGSSKGKAPETPYKIKPLMAVN